MPHYQNSIIYKIKHNEDYDDTNIYVGSTTNFKNRKNNHNRRCNNEKDKKYNLPVYKYIRDNGGWNEWVMIPIEEYPCNSKKELEVKERYHIDLLRPTLNKNIPTRTVKEYIEANKEIIAEKAKKQYKANKEQILEKCKKQYEVNKEQILEKCKKKYETNKEQILEKCKKYYEDNKEIINEKSKEKVICDHCGCESTKSHLKRHQKSKKCLKLQEDNVAR